MSSTSTPVVTTPIPHVLPALVHHLQRHALPTVLIPSIVEREATRYQLAGQLAAARTVISRPWDFASVANRELEETAMDGLTELGCICPTDTAVVRAEALWHALAAMVSEIQRLRPRIERHMGAIRDGVERHGGVRLDDDLSLPMWEERTDDNLRAADMAATRYRRYCLRYGRRLAATRRRQGAALLG